MTGATAQTTHRPAAARRIFWLGAHKVLVRTELARLRALGYEVFNPPYLSHVRDQSAVEDWERDQPSTLPREVFDTLASVNFFYAPIDDDVAALLNHYFDAAVATILPRWCAELVRVFRKPILYRAYGQTGWISDEFERIGARPLIERHEAFRFAPHAAEAVDGEADWLTARMSVAPYALTPDVFTQRDAWSRRERRSGDILVTAPNITNPMHAAHYRFLKTFFAQPHFRYVGVQPEPIDDPQLVGTLPRDELIEMFLSASGYFYSYADPRVCYLPPIEMMVYGGPVIYRSGSLLARYFDGGGPGACASIDMAHRRAAQLRQGDRALAAELIAAQEPVRRRYDPQHVTPLFDALALDVLGPPHARGAASAAPAPRNAFRGLATQEPVRRFLCSVFRRLEHIGAAAAPAESVEALRDDCRNLVAPGADDAVAGAWALLRDAVAGPVATGRFSDVDQRRHLGVGATVGREIVDAATMRPARMTDRRQGYLSYGPYAVLAAGRHRVQIEFRIDHAPEGAVGQADVTAEGRVLAAAALREGAGLQVVTLDFTLAATQKDVEFRVFVQAGVDAALFSITHHAQE